MVCHAPLPAILPSSTVICSAGDRSDHTSSSSSSLSGVWCGWRGERTSTQITRCPSCVVCGKCGRQRPITCIFHSWIPSIKFNPTCLQSDCGPLSPSALLPSSPFLPGSAADFWGRRSDGLECALCLLSHSLLPCLQPASLLAPRSACNAIMCMRRSGFSMRCGAQIRTMAVENDTDFNNPLMYDDTGPLMHSVLTGTTETWYL